MNLLKVKDLFIIDVKGLHNFLYELLIRGFDLQIHV